MARQPKAATPKLTQRNGRWITKTAARKTYRLAASDLDSILPVTDVPSTHNSRTRMKTYNVKDVEDLVRRLRTPGSSKATASTSGTTDLAAANGSQIMRTNAMKEFGLESVQMDRIKPVRVLPNPHRAGTMRFYNRCDVKALADSIAAAAAAPTGTTGPAHNIDSDDDYNVFDGMSGEAAAFKLAQLTGIVGPAMAYCQ